MCEVQRVCVANYYRLFQLFRSDIFQVGRALSPYWTFDGGTYTLTADLPDTEGEDTSTEE